MVSKFLTCMLIVTFAVFGESFKYIPWKPSCPHSLDDDCTLPAHPGPCKAYKPRYFYNTNTGQCELFIYGGCQGNANNFVTIAECQNTCVRTCTQPKKVGPCKARKLRWYFNNATCRCETFYWGGCQANGNNFKYLKQCLKTCPKRKFFISKY